MDQNKVMAIITNWPVLSTVKELQRFLGFISCYRRFRRGFSTIASPLSSLCNKKQKNLRWNTSEN